LNKQSAKATNPAKRVRKIIFRKKCKWNKRRRNIHHFLCCRLAYPVSEGKGNQKGDKKLLHVILDVLRRRAKLMQTKALGRKDVTHFLLSPKQQIASNATAEKIKA
jgi:hypothetical protein